MKLSVACLDEDLALVDAGVLEDVDCRVEMLEEDGAFAPERITANGQSSPHHEFEPALPPGVTRHPQSMVFTGRVQNDPSTAVCPQKASPMSVIYEIEESDAGPAWTDRQIAVRVPCNMLTVTTGEGGERVPYDRVDRHRVTVERVTFYLSEIGEWGPRLDAWLVKKAVLLPKQ